MRTIPDESALQLPENHVRCDFIRCDQDPYALIHGWSGEVYCRTDGLRWSHPAYRISLNRDKTILREFKFPNTGDTTVYPYPDA